MYEESIVIDVGVGVRPKWSLFCGEKQLQTLESFATIDKRSRRDAKHSRQRL